MAFDISKFAGTAPVPVSDSDGMVEIPVENIVDNPKNFYPKPDEAALTALMESIQANGLLEPPTVVPGEGGKYRLISGHSRMAAMRTLRRRDDLYGMPPTHQWDTVLCRVLEPMDGDRELSAVIEANRQRVKSPALLSEEAEKLAEAYVRRQDAGEELPDTVRNMVAQALQINRTKVSNLKTIREGLKVPGIRDRWERDELPEAAALVIAKMDIDTQYRLTDWINDNHKRWNIRDVQMFENIWTLCRHNCPETAGLCPHAERMVREKLRGSEFHCAGCCDRCRVRDTCSICCAYARAQRPKAPEPEAASPMPTEPPEGQLTICGWMPGGTNPGPESGLCVGLMRLAPDHPPTPKVLWWDGALGAWKFSSRGERVSLEPVWWLRLPPVPEKGE